MCHHLSLPFVRFFCSLIIQIIQSRNGCFCAAPGNPTQKQRWSCFTRPWDSQLSLPSENGWNSSQISLTLMWDFPPFIDIYPPALKANWNLPITPKNSLLLMQVLNLDKVLEKGNTAAVYKCYSSIWRAVWMHLWCLRLWGNKRRN